MFLFRAPAVVATLEGFSSSRLKAFSKAGTFAIHEDKHSSTDRKDIEELLSDLRLTIQELDRGQITREEKEKVRDVVKVMLR